MRKRKIRVFGKIVHAPPLKKLLFAISIGIAVVAFWRGVWGMMDLFLFPNNYLASVLTSLLGGLVILIVTHYATKELI